MALRITAALAILDFFISLMERFIMEISKMTISMEKEWKLIRKTRLFTKEHLIKVINLGISLWLGQNNNMKVIYTRGNTMEGENLQPMSRFMRENFIMVAAMATEKSCFSSQV